MLYLDYAATTPLDERVLAAMLPYFKSNYANPSSLHTAGQRARRGTEAARERVAEAIGAQPKEIIFTSGATEADNQALRAVAAAHPGGHILTSRLEHAAVLKTCETLARGGYDVSFLEPDDQGAIRKETVAAALRENTVLVALMKVNNETGVRTDVAAVAELLRDRDTLLFCDAVQAFGFETLDVNDLGVDLLSLSAHKVYGPKGVGVLYVRHGVELPPLLWGGEQERGLRAGTHNTPAIVGMGAAADLVPEWRDGLERLRALRDCFEARALAVAGVRVNGGSAPRGPKHSNLRVDGVDGEALLMNLDALGVCVSAGSACAAGSLEPSHVLTAMGLSREAAKASVRFSFGHGVTEAEADEAAARFAEAVMRCRRFAEV